MTFHFIAQDFRIFYRLALFSLFALNQAIGQISVADQIDLGESADVLASGSYSTELGMGANLKDVEIQVQEGEFWLTTRVLYRSNNIDKQTSLKQVYLTQNTNSSGRVRYQADIDYFIHAGSYACKTAIRVLLYPYDNGFRLRAYVTSFDMTHGWCRPFDSKWVWESKPYLLTPPIDE